jgi:hypothetical protein
MNRSVLELRAGGLPLAHGGADGEWRYRHATRLDGPALDHQVLTDFLAYETGHGRRVGVLAAVVVHASQHRLIVASAGRLRDRLAVVSVDCPSPQDWAVAATAAAEQLSARAAAGAAPGPGCTA